MEFEFTRNTLMGEYYVKCSMGHEIVGRWLQDEIGRSREKIEKVEQLIAQSKALPTKEHKLLGHEISMTILADEVLIQENVLSHGDELDEESEYHFYNSESTAGCGIDDFEILIERWIDFLGF
ncbi:YacL family protein [Vibrio sp. YMD68]|uniref:YacL family protein n=1 Tax=Vibrio sp. YMD68 TaxID=3042300 RepID=UPI00249A7398|nr:YacL family protein [Vibrio sp. YMD68]WGV99862.1 YacL family protein [Vibrio sp. YMD68]